MKHCLDCGAQYDACRRDCPDCGAAPAVVHGFDAYAPDLAHGGGGFDEAYFSELVGLEEANFWFRARNDIIIWAAKTYAPGFGSFCEIGCGTGFVLAGIARAFPAARLTGTEIFTAGLQFAAMRLPTVDFVQMDARRIPFVDEFDVVGAFDVLEHISEDKLALGQIYRSLRTRGKLLLTVPQHAWLWSAVDEYSFHQRRYGAAELHGKVEAAGFRIIRSTSFVTTLMPAMVLSRILRRKVDENFDPTAELKLNPVVNAFFEWLLKVELAGIGRGLNYPFGGSRLVVAERG